MTYNHTMYRPGLTAIAALLALSATPALAQEATPTTITPVVTVPVTTPTVDPIAADPAPAADPLAPSAEPAPVAKVTKTTRTTTTHRTATVAKPVHVAAAAPVAKAAPAPAVEAAQPAPLPATPVAAGPVAAAPVPVQPAPVATTENDDMLPIAGAAGLGLLGLLGAAFAMRRRKRVDEEDYVAVEQHEPAFAAPVAAEPIAEPRITPARQPAEAPAFAWAAAPAGAASSASASSVPEGVHADPGSHVERAYAGPSPDNPSLSLKKRLKRAAFFDQRERMAAQGKATPLARDAGLPAAAVASAPRRERKPAKAPMSGFAYRPAYQPA